MSYSLQAIADMTAQLATYRLQLVSLRTAQSSGVTRVTHGDRTVQYRSGSELAFAIRDLEDQIAKLEEALGLRVRPRVARTVVFIAGKGI